MVQIRAVGALSGWPPRAAPNRPMMPPSLYCSGARWGAKRLSRHGWHGLLSGGRRQDAQRRRLAYCLLCFVHLTSTSSPAHVSSVSVCQGRVVWACSTAEMVGRRAGWHLVAALAKCRFAPVVSLHLQLSSHDCEPAERGRGAQQGAGTAGIGIGQGFFTKHPDHVIPSLFTAISNPQKSRRQPRHSCQRLACRQSPVALLAAKGPIRARSNVLRQRLRERAPSQQQPRRAAAAARRRLPAPLWTTCARSSTRWMPTETAGWSCTRSRQAELGSRSTCQFQQHAWRAFWPRGAVMPPRCSPAPHCTRRPRCRRWGCPSASGTRATCCSSTTRTPPSASTLLSSAGALAERAC